MCHLGFYLSKYTCQLIQSNRCSFPRFCGSPSREQKHCQVYMCAGFSLYNFVPIAIEMMGTFDAGTYLKSSNTWEKELHCIQCHSGFFPPYSTPCCGDTEGSLSINFGYTASLLVDEYSSFSLLFVLLCLCCCYLFPLCFLFIALVYICKKKKTFETQNKQNCNCNTQTW